jgi:hypothetical protein
VVPDDPSYLSNCEFAPASDAFYSLSRGVLHRPIALKLRRGTVVEIAVSDPFGVLGRPSGFHFQPSLIADGGHVKLAKLTGRIGTTSNYSASIPLDSTASLFVDTRLIVLGEDGKPLTKLDPTGIGIRGGPAVTRINLTVKPIDTDLRPVKIR